MSLVRQSALLLLLVSAALLLGAFGFEHLGGLPPCEMCWWQRYAHGAVFLVAGVAYVANNRFLGWLAVVAMLVSAGLGLYHAGVELKWWQGVTSCTAPVQAGLSTAEMLEALRNVPLVRCDAIPWSFLGLSMAAWNALISTGAAFCAGMVLVFAGKAER